MAISKFATRCSIVVGFLVLGFGAYFVYYFKYVLSEPGVETPFLEAHEKAVRSFVDGEHFGIARFKKRGYFHERSLKLGDEVWKFDEVYLIGASPEYGQRYYLDGYVASHATKDDLAESSTRPLFPGEIIAVSLLREKQSRFYQLNVGSKDSGETKREKRVLAPIIVEGSCLKCHQGRVGDILGVFDYHLSK